MVGTLIPCPTNKVKEFARFRISVVIFGVRYFMEFIFYITVNLNGFGWWQSSVLKSVWDLGLKLRDVENGVYPAEIVGK